MLMCLSQKYPILEANEKILKTNGVSLTLSIIKGYPQKPIGKLQITGEGLMVSALESIGHFKQGTWEIYRDKDENPTLSEKSSIIDGNDGYILCFLTPIGRAMGGAAADLFNKEKCGSKS